MSEIVEMGTYSSFSTIGHDLREVKQQMQMMQDNIKALYDTVQEIREERDSIRFSNLQNQESSFSQDNRGFAAQNERNVQEHHAVDISLG